jgi:hypothetical protein
LIVSRSWVAVTVAASSPGARRRASSGAVQELRPVSSALTGGQQRITRLTGHGCAVLWLALDMALCMDGAHLITLDNPAEAADVIGRAATHALRTT